MKKHLHFTILLFIASITHAQTWTSIATFNQVIEALKSNNGKLYIGGDITQRDGHDMYWTSVYDGSNFVDQQELIGGTGVSSYEVYKGEMYATGGLDINSTVGCAVWDSVNNTWLLAGDMSQSTSGIYADGNDLYVGGDFSKVFKSTNGGAWAELPNFQGTYASTKAINKYGGQIICAGSELKYNNVVFNNICAYTGSTWVAMGNGLDNDVLNMAIYNNELYAVGRFEHSGSTAMAYIAKWNGTSWSPVGNGTATSNGNGIRDLIVFNGKLYVCGDFTMIGGVTAKYVAAWNGSSWEAVNLTETNFPNAITVYNNKIYVGTFSFSASKVYRLDAIVSVKNKKADYSFSLFPNPVNNTLNVICKEGVVSDVQVTVYDILGKAMLAQKANGRNFTLDVSRLQAGNYVLDVRDNNGDIIATEKFTRQ